jgi:hypothetical protein
MSIKAKLRLATFLGLANLGLAASCYDSSKVPPCTGGEKWPDPCAAAPRDAGQG